MRLVVRSLRQLHRFTEHYAEGQSATKRLFRQHNAVILSSSASHLMSPIYHTDGVSRFVSPRVELLQNMFSAVAAGSISGGPMVEYKKRITSGDLVDGDSFQVDTIQQLQRLYVDLIENEEACQLDRYQSSEKYGRSRWLWSRLITKPSIHAPVKGLYLYGGVGTGKTMLMDLFYGQLLFRYLFSKGVILVSTSNRAPDQLYEGGLQRNLFLPFIDTLKERCVTHPIGSAVDYRQLGSALEGFYFVGEECSTVLKQKFQTLVGDEEPTSQTVEVIMGRQLQVPLGANGCAYIPFEDLCDRPLGAADYFGLFKRFHTLAVDGVPKFGYQNRTAVYRFITLVDVIYENKGRLLCTAEATPLELFENVVTVAEARKRSPRSSRSQKHDDPDLCVDNELGFAKDRTISRLTELNSREYLEHFETKCR